MAGSKVMMPGSMEYEIEGDSSILFRFAGWLDNLLKRGCSDE